MSKDYRRTSKLAVTGFICAVAGPCLTALLTLLMLNGISQTVEDVFAFILPPLPFIALFSSIAGVFISIKKDMKGMLLGSIGSILAIVEIALLIFSISNFLTRMQGDIPV